MTEGFAWDPPARYNFTRDAIGRHAAVRPDDLALLWTDAGGGTAQLSFAALFDQAKRAATVLTEAGVRRGDTVLVLLSREIEWWPIMLGCMAIGAIASPGTTQLSAKDIAYRHAAAAARCVIASDDIAARVTAAGLAPIHVRDFAAAMTAAAPIAAFADTAFDEDALCYFTSGTTGMPKMTIHGAGYPMAHEITGRFWLDLGPGDLHWNLSDTGWAKAA